MNSGSLLVINLIYGKNFPVYKQLYDQLLSHSPKTAKNQKIAQL